MVVCFIYSWQSEGRSHFIIDHPSTPRVHERMRRSNEEDEVQSGDRTEGHSTLLFFYGKNNGQFQSFMQKCIFM